MTIFQMPRFKKYVKKLPRHLQQVILDAVEDVLADTEIGELKKGDLEGFKIHKFMMGRQLTLMAYKIESDSLVLYQVDPHKIFIKSEKIFKGNWRLRCQRRKIS